MAKEKPSVKLCRHCKTEIPYGAKVCPNCRRKQKRGVAKWIILAIVVIFIIALIATGNNPSAMPEPEKVEYIGDKDIAKVYADANDYIGKYIRFNGKVLDVEKSDDNTTLQVYEDIENYENNTYVTYKGEIDIKDDDYVSIDGYITGSVSGTNAFGGTLSLPSVMAKSVKKISYIDAVAPSLKTIEVGKTVEKSGYKLTLDKVEFAKKETRMYFTFKNDGKEDFALQSLSAKVVQDAKQLDAIYPDGEYEMLPDSSIAQGVEASGVIVFDAMEQEEDFTVSTYGWPADTIEDYTFEFDVSVK